MTLYVANIVRKSADEADMLVSLGGKLNGTTTCDLPPGRLQMVRVICETMNDGRLKVHCAASDEVDEPVTWQSDGDTFSLHYARAEFPEWLKFEEVTQ